MTKRRTLLKGAIGSLFTTAPFARVWAQSDNAVKLLRAPKHALVIGNARYRKVPLLVNPPNDAKAIGAALQESGFAVTSVLDADRAALAEAITAYVDRLQASKAVGVFYYAGHGLQLGWRNYLVPVDAAVAKPEDIPLQCQDVGDLIGGIKRAANPMNVIILDACRENPFNSVPVERKGLSQMDAPSGTLLAYATAPGNLASDGEGANGLYTENLLREMRVREAKIEDVFKRVRLNVRLASKGAQIPWESTSLEEDFYFSPPEVLLRKVSQQKEEELYREERALFEAARDSRDPAKLTEYLRRHPSGRFAELAQLALDRVLLAQGERPVQAEPAEGNPHTAGSARADTGFRVGDTYTYRVQDRRRGADRVVRQVVTAITEDEVHMNGGVPVYDLLGNLVLASDGRRYGARQDVPLEYMVGKRWSTRAEVVQGGEGTLDLSFRIVARERITVPAGTFDCFRIEGHGFNNSLFRPPTEVRLTLWRAPQQVRRTVAHDDLRRQRGEILHHERWELQAYQQA